MVKDIRNYSLLNHNTFKIEAKCDRFVDFSTTDELLDVLPSLQNDLPALIVLGAGSNLLLTQDYHGTVVHSSIKGREATVSGTDILLRCGSGETFDDIVAYATDNGWHGMENLSLIPGEVGASAVQNIGAYGAEAKDVISLVEMVEIATGKQVAVERDDCGFGYRYSHFKGHWAGKYIVTHVTYRLSTVFSPRLDYGNIKATLQERGIDNPSPTQLRQAIIDIRQSKLPDPKVTGNAGSFFMNPVIPRETFEKLVKDNPGMPHFDIDSQRVKVPAAWLIDQCGWKGKALGRAGVHDKQPLVLINRGGATGKEVLNLCKAIRDSVSGRFGIDITPEVNIR